MSSTSEPNPALERSRLSLFKSAHDHLTAAADNGWHLRLGSIPDPVKIASGQPYRLELIFTPDGSEAPIVGTKAEAEVRAWNDQHPIGTKVAADLTYRGPPYPAGEVWAKTNTPAYVYEGEAHACIDYGSQVPLSVVRPYAWADWQPGTPFAP